jgi:outer membrane protein assembly factor BamB
MPFQGKRSIRCHTVFILFHRRRWLESHAYFGTFDGRLYDVDLEKRSYSGIFATPGFDSNGKKYFSADGKFLAENVWQGDTLDNIVADLRGKLFSMGSIVSSPVISNGKIYFGSVDGNLYAIGQ